MELLTIQELDREAQQTTDQVGGSQEAEIGQDSDNGAEQGYQRGLLNYIETNNN